MDNIKKYYDEEYDEWARLERHKIEFDITKRYLDQYINADNLEIIDIGGGPGRYSFYLAEKGHNVTLIDLSENNIEVAKKKSKELGIVLNDYICENVLKLNLNKQFDVVLLMGPLYHLTDENDRKKAIENSLKLLKPNGIIIAAFISNYAAMMDYLKNLYPIKSPDDLLYYLKNGINNVDQGFTTAYFSSFEETRGLMNSFNLKELVLAAVENVLSFKEDELIALEKEEYDKWLEIGFQLCEDPNVRGASHHFLYIGKKL